MATAAVPLLAAALVLPAAVTTFGLGIRDGGPLGIRPVADGWAVKATDAGEIGAVHRMCAALPRQASVVMIGSRVSGRFSEVVRGMCGYPAAVLPDPTQASVRRVARRIVAAGRQPVLLAGSRAQLAPYGTGSQRIMLLHTTLESATLLRPPETVHQTVIKVWMLEVAR